MNNKFCPECAAQCSELDFNCPECGFPMVIDVVSEGQRIIIRGEHVSRWNRLAQLLRRNGMTINTTISKSTAHQQIWWALPGAGLLVFLLSLLLGQPLADAIWPPPPSFSSPLASSATSPDAPQEPQSDAVETAFLQDALKASEQQRYFEEQIPDEEEIFPLQAVSVEEIRRHMRQARCRIEVGERKGFGVLMSEFGHVLVLSSLIEGAFERKTTTVLSEGTLVEDYRTVYPKASVEKSDLVFADLVEVSSLLDIALLKIEVVQPLDFALDFDDEPEVGEAVWVGVFRGDKAMPEAATVIDQKGDASRVTYYRLDTAVSAHDEGAGIFDQSGTMIGILVRVEDQDCLLTNFQIRDKAPLIYKALLGP